MNTLATAVAFGALTMGMVWLVTDLVRNYKGEKNEQGN